MESAESNKRNLNQSSLLGRDLPSNIEAERSVLGSLLLHEESAHVVFELLEYTDFYLPSHRIIYEAMSKLFHKNQRLDFVTLHHHLEIEGRLDLSGGLVYLMSLQEEIPVIGLIEQYAAIVKEKSILRDLIQSASFIISNCYSPKGRSVESLLDDAERMVFRVAEQKKNQYFVQLPIWLKKTFQHLSDIKDKGAQVTGVTTGFRKLDELTSGFQNGDFVVLAARPSMGKTALALKFADSAARAGLTVGFFSLEMSAEQLVLRLLSMDSGIPHHNIRNASISSDDWISLTHVAARLAELKIFIEDTALQTMAEIRTKSRKLKRDHNLQLIIIDYLQLIHMTRSYENRNQEVAEISRSLKALAKELNIPIIALSQLSRAVESRLDKRPMLFDLRESGAIEQDADLIMLLFREFQYNTEVEDPTLSELIIGKHRNGATATVYLCYQREYTSFVDYDH